MKNHRHYLIAEIDYFDFVTGLLGKLNNTSERIRFKSVINIFVHYDEVNHTCNMDSVVFACCEFLSFVNGSYDGQDLKTLNYKSKWAPKGFEPPITLKYETWEMIDNNPLNWKLIEETTISGIKWLSAAHSTDGGDRCCAGLTKFYYEDRKVCPIEDGQLVEMQFNTSYPAQKLIDWVKQRHAKLHLTNATSVVQ